MRYGMVIDLKRCSGCKTCSVVCKVANNIPNNIIWNRVLTEGGNAPDTAGGTWDNPEMQHWPVACQHCENPACTKVCPVGATWKDPADGRCAPGLRQVHRLPHVHGRLPLHGRPLASTGRSRPYYVDYAVGDADVAEHREARGGEVHLLLPSAWLAGEQPACVASTASAVPATSATWTIRTPRCPSFGRAASTSSCCTELGTKPSVYYLV